MRIDFTLQNVVSENLEAHLVRALVIVNYFAREHHTQATICSVWLLTKALPVCPREEAYRMGRFGSEISIPGSTLKEFERSFGASRRGKALNTKVLLSVPRSVHFPVGPICCLWIFHTVRVTDRQGGVNKEGYHFFCTSRILESSTNSTPSSLVSEEGRFIVNCKSWNLSNHLRSWKNEAGFIILYRPLHVPNCWSSSYTDWQVNAEGRLICRTSTNFKMIWVTGNLEIYNFISNYR